jgi:hypothetical protein
MQMSTPKRLEVRRETDQVKEHRGNSRGDTPTQKVDFNGQVQPRNPVGPNVPDRGAFETFDGGAGI